jgi:hypothetical protein
MKEAKMKAAHICAVVATSLWLLVLAIGVAGIHGVSTRDIPGYPNAAQIRYYLLFPGAVLLAVLGAWLVALRRPIWRAVAVCVALSSLAVFPFYFFHFTGGV